MTPQKQPEPADVAPEFVEVCGMLSSPVRLQLLMLLRDGEQCVGWLAEQLRLSQASTSHHLALLRRAGLVDRRRDGTFIFYSAVRRSPDQIVSTPHLSVWIEEAWRAPRSAE